MHIIDATVHMNSHCVQAIECTVFFSTSKHAGGERDNFQPKVNINKLFDSDQTSVITQKITGDLNSSET